MRVKIVFLHALSKNKTKIYFLHLKITKENNIQSENLSLFIEFILFLSSS